MRFYFAAAPYFALADIASEDGKFQNNPVHTYSSIALVSKNCMMYHFVNYNDLEWFSQCYLLLY